MLNRTHGQRHRLGPRNDSDVRGYAAANALVGRIDDEIRAAMGDRAPHAGDRPEKALISSFVEGIAELSPQPVTFNSSSFDLPVLRYRAMVHGVGAPGLAMRSYFNRYTEDATQLPRGSIRACHAPRQFRPEMGPCVGGRAIRLAGSGALRCASTGA